MPDQAPIRIVGFRVLDGLYINRPTQSGLHVLRNPQDLEALVSDSYRFAPTPAPQSDWQQEMIIVVALGTRPTGGYSVRVDQLTEQDGTLTVHAREIRPGKEDDVTQALTYPCTAIATPAHPGPIEYEISTAPDS